MIVLYAASLDALSTDDVKYAALGMKVLPPNIARPEPKQPAEPDPADEVSVDAVLLPESGAELAQSPDS